MGWPFFFRRRLRPIAGGSGIVAPEQQEPWFPGDLAECLISTWYLEGSRKTTTSGPRTGKIYTVGDVHEVGELTVLVLSAFAPNQRWSARGFRKVRLGADQLIRAEPDFIALLRCLPALADHSVP